MTVYANIPFNPAIWVDLPASFPPEAPDALSWAKDLAQGCWIDSGLSYERTAVDRLATVLTKLADSLGPGAIHPEHASDPAMEIWTVLHLPDPRLLPVPLRIMVIGEDVVRSEAMTLDDLVQATDPEAIDAPDVAEFEHPLLGVGLRAFRHRALDPESDAAGDVFAVLKYAFRIPDHDDLMFVSLSWPDLARVAEARDDIDELVRCIRTEYSPSPVPGAA